MSRFFLISIYLLLPHTYSMASSQSIKYDATFGIFGTIGSIENTIKKENKKYTIHSTVTFSGLAKLLMGGQTEYYISKGFIKKGLMISNFYSMASMKNDTKKLKEYFIDHENKRVIKRVRKWKNKILVQETKEVLTFYAKNDLLTLYFNLGVAVATKGKTYHFKAVGLEKQNGKVQITVPSLPEEKSYIKELGAGSLLYAKALIYQKNFKNKKGDILLSLASDSYIEKCVIKDILMFGDAKIFRAK